MPLPLHTRHHTPLLSCELAEGAGASAALVRLKSTLTLRLKDIWAEAPPAGWARSYFAAKPELYSVQLRGVSEYKIALSEGMAARLAAEEEQQLAHQRLQEDNRGKPRGSRGGSGRHRDGGVAAADDEVADVLGRSIHASAPAPSSPRMLNAWLVEQVHYVLLRAGFEMKALTAVEAAVAPAGVDAPPFWLRLLRSRPALFVITDAPWISSKACMIALTTRAAAVPLPPAPPASDIEASEADYERRLVAHLADQPRGSSYWETMFCSCPPPAELRVSLFTFVTLRPQTFAIGTTKRSLAHQKLGAPATSTTVTLAAAPAAPAAEVAASLNVSIFRRAQEAALPVPAEAAAPEAAEEFAVPLPLELTPVVAHAAAPLRRYAPPRVTMDSASFAHDFSLLPPPPSPREAEFRVKLQQADVLAAVDALCATVRSLKLADVMRLAGLRSRDQDEELQLLGFEDSVVRSRIRAALRE